jgi:hypothetical protein
MKKLLSFLMVGMLAMTFAGSAKAATSYQGKLLLQTQGKGELWYVNPNDNKRYQLPNQADKAYRLLTMLSTTIDDRMLKKIPVGADKAKGDMGARQLYNGLFLASQDDVTRLWYVWPKDMKRYWFDGTDPSYKFLQKKAVGALDKTLKNITVGEMMIEEPVPMPEEPVSEYAATGTIQGLPVPPIEVAPPLSAIVSVIVTTSTRAEYDDSTEPKPSVKITFDKAVKNLAWTIWDTTPSSTQVWTQAYPFEYADGQMAFTLSASNMTDGMGYTFTITAEEKDTGLPIKYDGSFHL